MVTIVDPQRNLEISREVGPSLPIIEPFYRDGYIPYACRSGKCSACVAKLLHGEIDHGEQQFLTKKWVSFSFLFLFDLQLNELILVSCSDVVLDGSGIFPHLQCLCSL